MANRRQPRLYEKYVVWMRGLPHSDREDNSVFWLDDDDFARVEDDLKDAIERHIGGLLASYNRPLPPGVRAEDKVERVYVQHVQQRNSCLERQATHEGKRRLSGHAFAVMKRPAYAAMMLVRDSPCLGLHCLRCLPGFVHWRAHNLFKFGKPPWAAVTLRCQRSPPRKDIIWNNLHGHYSWLYGVLLLLLFLFVLVVAVPVSLIARVYDVIDALREEQIFQNIVPPSTWDLLGALAQGLPSYLLVLLNGVLLPSFIAYICDFTVPHLRSQSEQRQFNLNCFFLVLNSLLLPLVGLVSTSALPASLWARLRDVLWAGAHENAEQIFHAVGTQGIEASGHLMLKYMINAALFTGAGQLTQLARWFLKKCCQCCLAPEFPWGYWYAWAMSMMFLALTMSVVMPTVLPVAAVFFSMMHWAHGLHLRNKVHDGIFKVDHEMASEAEIWITCHMFKAACLLCHFMALFLFAQPVQPVFWSRTFWIPNILTIDQRKFVMPSCCLAVLMFLRRYGGQLEDFAWKRYDIVIGVIFLLQALGTISVLLFVQSLVTLWDGVMEWEKIQVNQCSLFALQLVVLGAFFLLLGTVIPFLGTRHARGGRHYDLGDVFESTGAPPTRSFGSGLRLTRSISIDVAESAGPLLSEADREIINATMGEVSRGFLRQDPGGGDGGDGGGVDNA